MRRFVPFGSKWAMGIDVPYSLAVIDRARLWSCGQCPLDLSARPLHPGNLAQQLRVVAEQIRDAFSPYGVSPDRITKLVAYVAHEEATPLEAVEGHLRQVLGSVPVIVTIGVPAFYYAGMMVEIDVYGSTVRHSGPTVRRVTEGVLALSVECGGERHIRLRFESNAETNRFDAELRRSLRYWGYTEQSIVSAHLFVDRHQAAALDIAGIAAALRADRGVAVLAELPRGSAVVADIVCTWNPGLDEQQAVIAEEIGGVRIIARRSGGMLGVSGRCLTRQPGSAAATERVMTALSATLTAHGLSSADVVKQQTFYVGGASEEDLYENMRVRNGYYRRPGPASTGLAVYGMVDAGCLITVELLAIDASGRT
jgi:enamine deaminase RidA (YjgF/YER057c/UK114 family)